LSHVESFGNGAWHLIFHYRANLAGSPVVITRDRTSPPWSGFLARDCRSGPPLLTMAGPWTSSTRWTVRGRRNASAVRNVGPRTPPRSPSPRRPTRPW
jgi:hypothetical protein